VGRVTPEQEHTEWAEDTLERLGPRPELRLTHVRAGGYPERRSFRSFVFAMLRNTPDDVILSEWRSWPLCDPAFRAVE
jgi:hypothetical protein